MKALFDTKWDFADAAFSPCGRYRYALWRSWDVTGKTVVFVMLNPSTADETIEDPTIRRCISFAKSWGFGNLRVGNLFALRSTDPLLLQEDLWPVGKENDQWLYELHYGSQLTVAAWGVHGELRGRGEHVRDLLERGGPIHHLGLTKDGHPRHPLYLPASAKPIPWTREHMS
jgi:hypothetical protein